MVDDLPHAGDPEQRRRLTELLVQLARSSRFPIALIVTGNHAQSGSSFGSGSKAGSFQGWHRVSLMQIGLLLASAATPAQMNCFIARR